MFIQTPHNDLWLTLSKLHNTMEGNSTNALIIRDETTSSRNEIRESLEARIFESPRDIINDLPNELLAVIFLHLANATIERRVTVTRGIIDGIRTVTGSVLCGATLRLNTRTYGLISM